MPKPGDFFIGAMEFFAILLPGAALVYLVQPWAIHLLPNDLLPRGMAQSWVVFLILAYIAGHLLHAGGGFLDDYAYDKGYLPRYRPEHVRARELRKKKDWLPRLREDPELPRTITGRAYVLAGDDIDGTSLYDWCLSLARLRSAAAAAEVDRHQADSKFFRSLVFVLAVAAVAMAIDAVRLAAAYWVPAIAAAAAAWFSLCRYCDLRWKATQRLYEYYLLLSADRANPTD